MEVSLRPTATAAATLETALLDLDQSAVRNEVAAEVAVPGASTGTSPTQAAPMEVSLRPTATAAATLETALLDLDQSAARNEVAAEVAVPGTLGGGTTQVVPTAEELSSSSRRSPAPAGGSMAPSLRQIETAAVATPGSEQPSLDHLAVHREELPVALLTVDPTPYIPHPTTDTCSAAAAPALRVETGSGRRGDLASRGIRASTPDMNFDTGVKPVRPPSAFDSAKEGDLSRLASLQPGAERGVTGAKCDAIRDGPKAAAARGCTSTERPAGASEGAGVAKACEQYGIHPKPYCEQTSTKSLCARPPLTRSEITTSTTMRAFGSTLDWNATHFIACLCYTLLLYT
jgi:hypothetical protein